jgi:predicted nucleotide-binding protein
MYINDFEKRVELLNSLLHQAEKMNYESRTTDIQLMDQKVRSILPYVTQDPKSKVEIFSKFRFTPRIISTSSTDNTAYTTQAFESGKAKVVNFVRGLIEENELIHSLEKSIGTPNVIETIHKGPKTKVFIVHGHDDVLKTEVSLLISKQGLEPIVLHEQPNQGKTIIEKIESYSDVDFAIVLYTPCDVGRSQKEEEERPRARQNVIFEHGYFVAKLGRENVVGLNKGEVDLPNDISGVVYNLYDEAGAWKYKILSELHSSGYIVDFTKA